MIYLRHLSRQTFPPMNQSAPQLFDAYARDYDVPRRRLVPDFDGFYGAVGDVLSFDYPPNAHFRVLDLGAGTGLLSSQLAARFPNARFTLADGAPQMLELARERFGDDARFEYLTHDFARDEIPGAFDAVVSALAIHHLEWAQLPPLFGRVHGALRAGGVFVNADQTLGTSPRIAEQFEAGWRANARRMGSSEEELQTAIERRQIDRHAPLETQLAALRDAGFGEVECVYKRGLFAVYGGWRAAE